MKNITVAVDEETYRLSRIRAAEAGTTVSARTETSAAAERRGRLLREVVADFDRRGVGLCIADNLSREGLYRDREPAAGGV